MTPEELRQQVESLTEEIARLKAEAVSAYEDGYDAAMQDAQEGP